MVAFLFLLIVLNSHPDGVQPARDDPQADEKLSHKEGEALVQRWAQESNVEYDSSLELVKLRRMGRKWGVTTAKTFPKT